MLVVNIIYKKNYLKRTYFGCVCPSRDASSSRIPSIARSVKLPSTVKIRAPPDTAFCVALRFWEKYITGKSINGLPMHAKRAHFGVFRKKCFISYVCISHVNSSVSIDTYVWTLKTFRAYYRSNVGTLKAFLTFHPVYCDTLWHDRTNVSNIPWWESIHS